MKKIFLSFCLLMALCAPVSAKDVYITSVEVAASQVRIFAMDDTIGVNGETITKVELPDDPADHRGILSWFAQKQDRHLHEAGSYGYPVEIAIPAAALAKAEKEGKIVIRLAADANGLALYGESFGRYPMDLTVKLQ